MKNRTGKLTAFAAASLLASVSAFAVGALAQDGAVQSTDPGKIAFAADTLTYDEKTGIVFASGHVEMDHKGYHVRAREIRYNEKTGEIEATKGLEITDQDGNVLTADDAQLTEDALEGIVINVKLILADGSQMAAANGERRPNRKTVLKNAVYSPCEICADDPGDKPLWQIKAVRVTHNQDKRKITYKNAFLEFLGVPVIWLPYFSHPDYKVERASGWLVPDIKISRELGFVFQMPYYQVLGQSTDATITPIWTGKEGLVLGGEVRRHFGIGTAQIEGSITNPKRRDDFNQLVGGHELRGHVFSNGQFLHGKNWRSTYKVEWASDDTYLRRYDFSAKDTLTSQYHLEGFYGRSYISAESLIFQGLRQEDDAGLTGFALPLIEAEYVSKPGKYGTVRLTGNALALHRTDGLDMRRVSSSAAWDRRFVTANGLVARFAANVRGDVYHVADGDQPDNPLFGGNDGSAARLLPQASATFSWPFAQFGKTSNQVIEPIVSLVGAPTGGNPAGVPNEDARAFELADTNIFSDNRFPGLDRWEAGSRASYGLKWNFYSAGIQSEVLFGQSYRFDNDERVFPNGTGLSGNFSDFVGRWQISIGKAVDIDHRFRLDKNSLGIRRNEIDATLGTGPLRVTAGYFQLNRDLEDFDLEDREEVRIAGDLRIDSKWRLKGYLTTDLTDGSDPIAHGGSILYGDDCLEFSLSYRRSFTRDRDIVPGTSVTFRIKLKQLG